MEINNIMEKVNVIKKRLSELEEELSKVEVEGQDDNNIITAILSGKGKILDYKLNLNQMGALNKDTLIKAVVDASNKGLQAARELEAEKRRKIVGDLDLPDMPGLF